MEIGNSLQPLKYEVVTFLQFPKEVSAWSDDKLYKDRVTINEVEFRHFHDFARLFFFAALDIIFSTGCRRINETKFCGREHFDVVSCLLILRQLEQGALKRSRIVQALLKNIGHV